MRSYSHPYHDFRPGSIEMSITTLMVPMRDGIRLATDVHLPTGRGPFPVIMERTPYGRAEASRSEITAADRTPAARADIAAYFTRHGYAVVYQDTRGRYGSEGVFVKYLSDGNDGFDTAAWLLAQPWCDGRFCTMGLSYAAHTQAAPGCLDPPGHSPLRHHPDYEAYLFEQWTHGAFDEYWHQLGIWTEGSHTAYNRAEIVHMSS